MRNFLSITLIALSFAAFGQNHFIGIKGGLNSTIVGIDEDWDNSFRNGFTGGLTYQYNVDQHFFAGVEMLYEERGYKSKTFFSFISQPSGSGDAVTFRYDYVSLPLKFGYRTIGDFSGFVSAGVVPAYLTKAEHYFPWYLEYGALTLDVTDLVKRFDLAGVLEIGCSYAFKPRLVSFLSLGYQHSFTTISQEGYFEENTVRNLGISLSTGIRYALKRE